MLYMFLRMTTRSTATNSTNTSQKIISVLTVLLMKLIIASNMTAFYW